MELPELPWRLLGPHRGGRVTAVAGHPTERLTFYFGAAAGGVWVTRNAGLSWQNLSDGFFRRPSVGALALAPSRPETLYVGLGESCLRNDVVPGDGVWRSDDGGAHFVPVGLEDTQHIGRIVVHPAEPHQVYVAALGHAFGPNATRGVYRSTDGGDHWDRVLYAGPDAGAVDLAMDPADARILYAALWEVRRLPWTFTSGGPGSALYRSTDGGAHWENISARPGLPDGVWGRVGLSTTPARPGRLWAAVEARSGGIFLSDDHGDHWTRTNGDPTLRRRPWYYNHIVADPVAADTVYFLDLQCRRSTDQGRSFTVVPTAHGDHHALWIDPRDPQRLINGHDGGAAVSLDGGVSWSSTFNQPTAQLYHVTTDGRVPYRVYGAQQDNSTISVPSQSARGVVTAAEWYDVGGGESGAIAVRPDNADIVYAANYNSLTRYDHASGDLRSIHPWPEHVGGHAAADVRYRFPWTFPVLVSPHDPAVLYTAAQVVFRSRNEGAEWTPISPDLTRNDPAKMGHSGGPITGQAMNAEFYGTISALAESVLQPGLLWAGTDDGRVHVSLDAGGTWHDVTPAELPEWTYVSVVEPSPHDTAVAYLAGHRYKLDDAAPYVFRTADGGQHWTRIVAGIPEDDWVRVVRADPVVPRLLYCGTETGVYASGDDGATWRRANANLPAAPIYDLAVHGNDLVAATHGRSFWVLDDVSPWRDRASGQAVGSTILYRPGDAVRWVPRQDGQGDGQPAADRGYRSLPNGTAAWRTGPDGRRSWVDGGDNPAGRVFVAYQLGDRHRGVRLGIVDETGAPVRTLVPEQPQEAGFYRVAWDLRGESCEVPLPSATRRPLVIKGLPVLPGTYRAVLSVDGQSRTKTFLVRPHPHGLLDLEGLRMQARLHAEVVTLIRRVARQVTAWRAWDRAAGSTVEAARSPRRGGDLATQWEACHGRISTILGRLAESDDPGPDLLRSHPAGLVAQLVALAATIAMGDAAPSVQARQVFALLQARFEAAERDLRKVGTHGLPALNAALAALEVAGLPDPPDLRAGSDPMLSQ